jgi:hypothetical protein
VHFPGGSCRSWLQELHTTKGAPPFTGRQKFSAFFLKYSTLLLDIERCEYSDDATDLRSYSDDIEEDLSNW